MYYKFLSNLLFKILIKVYFLNNNFEKSSLKKNFCQTSVKISLKFLSIFFFQISAKISLIFQKFHQSKCQKKKSRNLQIQIFNKVYFLNKNFDKSQKPFFLCQNFCRFFFSKFQKSSAFL